MWELNWVHDVCAATYGTVSPASFPLSLFLMRVPQYASGGQRTAYGSQFSPTMNGAEVVGLVNSPMAPSCQACTPFFGTEPEALLRTLAYPRNLVGPRTWGVETRHRGEVPGLEGGVNCHIVGGVRRLSYLTPQSKVKGVGSTLATPSGREDILRVSSP